jgi:hypothetical protein
VTSDGSAYVRFRRALDTGNIHLVRAAAKELSMIGLGDALRIVYVMREDEVLFERAAIRWLRRFMAECEDVTLEQIEQATGAMRAMWWDADGAVRTLTELCAANRVRL